MARVVVLGAAGAICQEAVRDLRRWIGDAELVLADINLTRLRDLACEIGADHAVEQFDVTNESELVRLVAGADVVINGLPKKYAFSVARAAIDQGVHAVDLGSPTEALLQLDSLAKERRATYVAGCGATPGVTNMIAAKLAEEVERVDEVHVSFAAFRSFVLSPSLIEVLLWEFDPATTDRLIYEDGQFKPVPPFWGEREVDFRGAIGVQRVYCVPHGETRTLPGNLRARRVYTRGCFTPKAMRFVRGLLDYGFFTREAIEFKGGSVVPREFIEVALGRLKEEEVEPLWGYGIHVEVVGQAAGQTQRMVGWVESPGSEEWGVPGAYSKPVGIPLSVAASILCRGGQLDYGVGAPEKLLPPQPFLDLISERGMIFHTSLLAC